MLKLTLRSFTDSNLGLDIFQSLALYSLCCLIYSAPLSINISFVVFRIFVVFFLLCLYLLEINTQPGMTKLSLVPEIAGYAGISFIKLIEWILKDASINR